MWASEVFDRKTLWTNPPPILVTNATMLEYMLVSACTKIFLCITIVLVATTFSALSPYAETVLKPFQLQAELNPHAIHTRCKQRDHRFAPKDPETESSSSCQTTRSLYSTECARIHHQSSCRHFSR